MFLFYIRIADRLDYRDCDLNLRQAVISQKGGHQNPVISAAPSFAFRRIGIDFECKGLTIPSWRGLLGLYRLPCKKRTSDCRKTPLPSHQNF